MRLSRLAPLALAPLALLAGACALLFPVDGLHEGEGGASATSSQTASASSSSGCLAFNPCGHETEPGHYFLPGGSYCGDSDLQHQYNLQGSKGCLYTCNQTTGSSMGCFKPCPMGCIVEDGGADHCAGQAPGCP